jgi:RES domain-containing protein
VHTSANDVPPEFTLLKIEGPDLDVPSIGLDTLPDDWQTKLEVTRDLGTSWLDKNETVLLHVPSAIVPQTMNCLFNPAHRRAGEFRIVEAIAYPFDARLKK